LGSNKFQVREKATKELERLGQSTVPQLRKLAESRPSLEVKRRIEQILRKLDTPYLSGDSLRLCRAIELLERIGDNQAIILLKTLAGGAKGSRLTQDAKAALSRLKSKKGQ